jgi:hypothetical protein
MMMEKNKSGVTVLLSENWGFFFILYSFIVFILAVISYTGFIKIPITELSLYISVSLAIGMTLQLLPSFIMIRKGASTGRTLISRLLYVNIGVFFYGYSTLLLWCSVFSYVLGDITQHFTFLEYGGISALAGILLHIASKALSLGRTSWIPQIIVLLIASFSSVFLFYNVLVPAKLSSLSKVLMILAYFISIPTFFYLSFKISGSILSGIFATLLITTTPLMKSIIISGGLSSLIFSVTYLCLILLIFYFKSRDIAVGLSAAAAAIQAFYSKAFPLTILLVLSGMIVERLRDKYKRYVTYLAFSIALLALLYLLLLRPDLVLKVFKIYNIYLIVTLTLSACLSIALLVERSPEDSSRISAASIPLMFGLLTYFNESIIALIHLALVLTSLSIIYLFKSITINKINEVEVEVTIELEKLLASSPAIALLFIAISEWF